MFQIVETDKMIHLVLEVKQFAAYIVMCIPYNVSCSFVLEVNCLIILLLKNGSRFDLLSYHGHIESPTVWACNMYTFRLHSSSLCHELRPS